MWAGEALSGALGSPVVLSKVILPDLLPVPSVLWRAALFQPGWITWASMGLEGEALNPIRTQSQVARRPLGGTGTEVKI